MSMYVMVIRQLVEITDYFTSLCDAANISISPEIQDKLLSVYNQLSILQGQSVETGLGLSDTESLKVSARIKGYEHSKDVDK